MSRMDCSIIKNVLDCLTSATATLYNLYHARYQHMVNGFTFETKNIITGRFWKVIMQNNNAKRPDFCLFFYLCPQQ